jgi:hypothetical protein
MIALEKMNAHSHFKWVDQELFNAYQPGICGHGSHSYTSGNLIIHFPSKASGDSAFTELFKSYYFDATDLDGIELP